MSSESIGFSPETEELVKSAKDPKEPAKNVENRTVEQFRADLHQTIDHLAEFGFAYPGGRITLLPHILELTIEVVDHDRTTVEILQNVEAALANFRREPVNPDKELTETEHDHVLTRRSELERLNLTNGFLSNHRSVQLLQEIQPYINGLSIRDQ